MTDVSFVASIGNIVRSNQAIVALPKPALGWSSVRRVVVRGKYRGGVIGRKGREKCREVMENYASRRLNLFNCDHANELHTNANIKYLLKGAYAGSQRRDSDCLTCRTGTTQALPSLS